jgi:hypothetical protein
MGDMDPPDCGIDDPTCHPLDPCEWTDTFDVLALCTDADGDCRPGACPDSIPVPLRDCDDQNAAIHPGAPERCNARDDDCDGTVDEAFSLGQPCSACGRDGTLECALDGSVACSVQAGQSDELLLDELCDQIDQDCDGVVDEGCLRPLPPGLKSAPRWCGDHLIYLADDRLTHLDLRTGMTEQLDDSPAVEPTCRGEWVAWLAADRCDGGQRAPRLCPNATLMLHEGGRTRALGVRGDLGTPIIGTDGIYLHEQGQSGSAVLRAPFSGQPPEIALNGFSDPTAAFDGTGVARRRLDERLQVELVHVDTSVRMALSSPENAASGRPARDGDLIAWTAGEPPVLWVLVEPAAQGTQVGPALPGRPRVFDSQVWWWAPDGLRRFDATSGITERVAGPAADVSTIWVGPSGRVQLVEEGARFWAADPPEPPQEPDMSDGPDMHLADMGAADMHPVDMHPADMRSPDRGDMGMDAAIDARLDATP